MVKVILNPKYRVIDVQRKGEEKIYTIGRARQNVKPKMNKEDRRC
ncbi:MAG: hypothetical protein ACTSXC_04790 [Candidatus Freyarchaeota archaeon]